MEQVEFDRMRAIAETLRHRAAELEDRVKPTSEDEIRTALIAEELLARANELELVAYKEMSL